MKSAWSAVFAVCFAAIANAQYLTPQVISSSGGFYSNASGSLSFTTAEMSAVATYSNASVILTQGFQQAWDFNTSASQHFDPDLSPVVYPNPSDGYFYLVSNFTSGIHIGIKIIDMIGNEILLKEILLENNINVVPINMTTAAEGIYLISIETSGIAGGPEKKYSKIIQIIR